MLFSAFLAGFLAGFTPFWGMLITVAYGYRFFQENHLKFYGNFAAGLIVCSFLLNRHYLTLSLFDGLLGVGFIVGILFHLIKKYQNLSKALLNSSAAAAVIASVRQIIFNGILQEQVLQNSQMTTEMSQELFSQNPEMLQMAIQSIEFSTNFFNDYGIGVTFLVYLSGLFGGLVWLIFRNKWQGLASSLKLPYWTVYPLIVSMVTFLLPGWQRIGGNLLFLELPFFLLQGIAISAYFLKIYQPRLYIWTFAVLVVFLNYLFFLFLLLLGIADLWLQFREKYQEKINHT